MELTFAAEKLNFEQENLNSKSIIYQDNNYNLKYISNDDLLFRTENLVQTERKIMHLVLSHILEIMNRKLYADLGFDSMYESIRTKARADFSAYKKGDLF